MERWDIYDKNRNLTGRTMGKNEWILQDGEYHLTVLGVVRHKDGRFLITRRVLTKAGAAGWWEVPGGAVQAGETSREAVNREVWEETGLDVSACAGEPLVTYHREHPGEGDNYFVDCYRFTLDFATENVKIRPNEAREYKLATLDEIKELAAQGILLHYDSIQDVFTK